MALPAQTPNSALAMAILSFVLVPLVAGWKTAGARAELRPIYDRAARKTLVAPDPQVAELVRPEHEATLAQQLHYFTPRTGEAAGRTA